MKKNIKKYLITLLFLSNIVLGISIPMANADIPQNTDLIKKITEDNAKPHAKLPAQNQKQDGSENPASLGNAAKAPLTNTTKFQVTKYLTAEGQEQSYLKNPNPIASFIVQMINFLVLTIGSLCFLSIVVGGFTLVISNGNENLVNKGKEIIKFAVIGLAIIMSSYIIVAFIQSLFYELPGK